MGICYFFSGFDKEKGFTPEIGKSLRASITERKSLVFVASCPYGHEKTDLYTGFQTNWFRDAGIVFENVYVLDDRKTESECTEIIKNASAVFLCGGMTLLQIEFIQKYNLIPLLQQIGGVIMGMSAGAINMAVNSFCSAYDDSSKTHIYEGISLADISVEPHFSLENTALIEKDLIPFSEQIDIYAIYDDSAIVVCNDKRQYYGDIYLISKGKIEKVN